MKRTMHKRICLTASLALLVSFTQVGFVCSPTTVTHSPNKKPSQPRIEGLEDATANDVEACVNISFSDTNAMDVSYNIYLKGPADAEFKRVVGGQGIPGTYTFFKDRSVLNGITYTQDVNIYVYRMYAVSAEDSVSDPSNADTILLAKPANISLVTLDYGYPFIQYSLTGQHGKEWRVDIMRGDISLDSIIYEERFSDVINETSVFPDIPVDTLRAIAQRDTIAHAIFGVRIISWTGSAFGGKSYGIAVSQFDAGP